jgi:hypothetical protein
MEKRIQIILFLLFIFLPLSSQTKVVSNNIRIPVWYALDPLPGVEKTLSPGDAFLTNAVVNIKEISPFILSGMIYGWNFSYTPSDKLRGVPEYFEFTSVSQIDSSQTEIRYTDPFFTDEGANLCAWVELDRTPEMMKRYYHWNSINFPKISGKGKAPVKESVNGIKKAFGEAIKEAVRTYAQGIEKNKPKEISGSVYLIHTPRYYIDSGFYVADLDFFLHVGKIVQYTQF